MNSTQSDNRVLSGPILSTFLSFVIPSVVGLIAITTATVVDGIFVGNFVGPDALASITLMLPYITLLFSMSLMLAIGGSVRGGKYLGERNDQAASAVFSKSLIAIAGFGGGILMLSLALEEWIFTALGAPEHLFDLMRPYFRVIMLALPLQLLSVVLYYFIRADNRPIQATGALVTGSIANILLDGLFVGYLGYGLEGAAWATLIAQSVQLMVLLAYFAVPKRRLRFHLIQRGWGEIASAAYNGLSEFINEISGGLVILVINWILMIQVGVDGVAAFTVVNYLIFLSLMVFYGIADSMHLLVSQNFGAGNRRRINQFLAAAAWSILLLCALFLILLFTAQDALVQIFLDGSAQSTTALAQSFIQLLWPLFLVNGLNVLISSYLTAMHLPLPSTLVALSRSLILPVGLLLALYWWLPQLPILLALPLAEWLTFLLAVGLFLRFRPHRLIGPNPVAR